MRRRALMAASQTGGGGIETTLQFPLYIYFDYCEEFLGLTHCYGSGDYAELKRLIKFVVETYGKDSGQYYRYVDEATLDELGLEIYVEGEKVRSFSIEYSTSSLKTDTYFAIVVRDSEIECDF